MGPMAPKDVLGDIENQSRDDGGFCTILQECILLVFMRTYDQKRFARIFVSGYMT